MTDQATRSQERSAETLEDRVHVLRARMRAGRRGREIDVPCGTCKGDKWLGRYDPEDLVICPTCNGSGRRTEWGLDLAAYCGDEAARALAPVRLTKQTVEKPLHWSPGAREFVEAGGLLVPRDLKAWINGLSRWGREVEERAEDAIDVLRVGKPIPTRWGGSLAEYAFEEIAGFKSVTEPQIRTAISDALVKWALEDA